MTANLDEFGTGLQKWGPQAWLDFVTAKLMMSKVGDVIPKTYMPILRLLSEDAAKVDDAYARVVAVREPVRLFDSPRDKWRKLYGSYIRELEWVYGELRQCLPTREYQDLVTDVMARTIRDALGAFLPSVEQMTRLEGRPERHEAAANKKPGNGRYVEKLFNGPIGRFMMNHMNPFSAIVGPVDMKIEEGGRQIEMQIPRCWMHTAPGDGRTQDQACVQGCKGACERVFNGNTPVAMLFEPHLPDYSCTIRVAIGSNPQVGS